jgi:osmoprotectant transport system permease protein
MTWLALSWEYVLELTRDHLLLSIPAILLSVFISIPIGRFAHRRPAVGEIVVGAVGLLYAIPALPLLIIIPAVFGFPLRSSATVVTALTVYGVALMARTAADAFGAVDAEVRAAALAVGHSPRGVFWRVDLPLAVPVLLSGTRVVAVGTVAMVTIGALIGVPGLGSLLTDGFQRGITEEVVVGVAATIAVALVLDGLLLAAGRALTPWTRAPRRSKALGGKR